MCCCKHLKLHFSFIYIWCFRRVGRGRAYQRGLLLRLRVGLGVGFNVGLSTMAVGMKIGKSVGAGTGAIVGEGVGVADGVGSVDAGTGVGAEDF